MKILVVGSGGREHALVWKICQSPHSSKVYCAPGNPGIARLAECVPIKAGDTPGLIAFAKRQQIDLTVVGPEQPLADGIVDRFVGEGLTVFGPTQRAAELEWSKTFAKDFMQRHRVPTASFRAFSAGQLEEALRFVQTAPLPHVVKADGLAAGKGVVVCRTSQESSATLEEMLSEKAFGTAGERVVIEECLVGEEASVFALSDGTDFLMLAPAQDHKRVRDGDQGKNTGGMGSYAPAPIATPEILRRVEREIVVPTLKGMSAEGRPYKGCLYVGLMLTSEGPKVVEFNSRFGDPETQVVLPLLEGDFVELLLASCQGTIANLLSAPDKIVSTGSAVCIVLASGGYPDSYEVGFPINGLDAVVRDPSIAVFHAGTQMRDGKLVTSGGRVVGVTAFLRHGGLRETIDTAYKAVELVGFRGMHYRRDIGSKALAH